MTRLCVCALFVAGLSTACGDQGSPVSPSPPLHAPVQAPANTPPFSRVRPTPTHPIIIGPPGDGRRCVTCVSD